MNPQNQESEPVQIELLPDSKKTEPKHDGKDEMNLAEFPICSLSGRQQTPEMTLEFSDSVWDQSIKGWRERQVTVAGTKKHGLPGAVDEEVLMALLQLSSKQNFPTTLEFSRYELINELNWQQSGRSYKRVEEAIDRWTSVSVDYQNAWREKGLEENEEDSWVDAKFHIIDFAKFHRRENKNSPDSCSIRWGDYIQRSFEAGNLRKFNFKQYLDYKSGISKRIYRFMGKRFWHKLRWELDLKEFAYEKVGISRTHNVGQIKQKLKGPLNELVQSGFIKDAHPKERYLKARVGEWIIILEGCGSKSKEKQAKLELEVESLPELEAEMVKRKVKAPEAKRLAAQYPAEFIQRKMELMDFLIGKGGASAPKKGGWLVSAITNDYDEPSDFKSIQQKLQEALERKEKEDDKKHEKLVKKAEMAALWLEKKAQTKRIQDFWDQLPKSERQEIAEKAKAEYRESGDAVGLEGQKGAFYKNSIAHELREQVLERLGEKLLPDPE